MAQVLAATTLLLSFFLPMGYSEPDPIWNPSGVHRFALDFDATILAGLFAPFVLCWLLVLVRGSWVRFILSAASAALAAIPALVSTMFGFKDSTFVLAPGFFVLIGSVLALWVTACANGLFALVQLFRRLARRCS